jgi:NTP pyrophosphatase (non-canonical NTP hydrolase)
MRVDGTKFKKRVLKEVERNLDQLIENKGNHTFASTHEILGVIVEEYHELIEAVQSNERTEVISELHDLAVAAIWGIVSAESEAMDW